MDILCFFCLVFAMPLYASVLCALWLTAGKGLNSWLSFVVSICECVTFPQVWYLIISIPDLCTLTYYNQTPGGQFFMLFCRISLKSTFSKKIFQEYNQSVKQFGSDQIRSKLFVKHIQYK